MAVKSKGKFNWKSKIKSNTEKSQSGSNYGYLNLSGVPMFKEKAKQKVNLDFLPFAVTIKNHPDKDKEDGVALKGQPWYRLPILVHRNVGAESKSIICPRTFGKKCPICEHADEIRKETNEYEDVKEFVPQKRILYWLRVSGNKEFDSNVAHLWDISRGNFQNLLDEELEDADNEANAAFPDIQDGRTLAVRFAQESYAGTKYAKASSIDFRKRKSSDIKVIKGLAKDLPDLADMLIVLPYDKILAMFMDAGVDEEEDDDAGSKKKKSSKKKEAEEKPAKGKKAKGSKKKSGEKSSAKDAKSDRKKKSAKPEKEVKKTSKSGKKEKASSKKTSKGKKEKSEKTDKKAAKKKGGKLGKSKASRCPSGYKFGKDVDEKPECARCPVWEKCLEASS